MCASERAWSASLGLVVGLDRRELAFERLELSVHLCFLLSGLVTGLLQPRALALHEGLECFWFRHC